MRGYMAYTQDEQKILKLSIRELRHIYNHISNIFDQLRLKALALIAGELVLIGFIFGADGSSKFKSLHYADEKVFFGIGIAALVVAFGLFLSAISTVKWRVPHDLESASKLLKKTHSDADEYLEYLHDYFVDANNHNQHIISPKLRRFNWTVYLLSAGVTILLVIKYGGIIK